MALPISESGPGGQLIDSLNAMNALTKSRLENKYYGPTQMANALSKAAYAKFAYPEAVTKFLSLPGVPQALGPEKYNQLISQLREGVNQQSPDLFGAASQGQSQGQGGLLSPFLSQGMNKLSKMFGFQGEDQPKNALMQAPNMKRGQEEKPSSGTPSGITPTVSFSNKPGTVAMGSQGQLTSIPTAKTISQTQSQLLAFKRVKPQLERLASEWEPFLNLKGKGKLLGSRVSNLLGDIVPEDVKKQFGIEGDLPKKYAKAVATTEALPESLLKAYGLNVTDESLRRMQHTIQPLWGEDAKNYKNRIAEQLEEMRVEQQSPSEETLKSGFNLSNEPVSQPVPKNENNVEGQVPPEGTVWMMKGKIKVPVHESRVDEAEKIGFKKVE